MSPFELLCPDNGQNSKLIKTVHYNHELIIDVYTRQENFEILTKRFSLRKKRGKTLVNYEKLPLSDRFNSRAPIL